jgi:two-component system, OmpR family, response regulator
VIRVLYVDDEADTEQFAVLFEVLRQYEIEAIPVRSVEGLEMAISRDSAAIDCIVLDIIMPPGHYDFEESERGRRTGILALDRIRERLGDVPVVVATVTSRRDIRAQATERGARKIITKPFLPSELAQAVRQALGPSVGAVNNGTMAD